MVRQDINTWASLFPWQVKDGDGAGLWAGPCLSISSLSFVHLLARKCLLSHRSWRDEAPVTRLCPPLVPETQPNHSRSDGRRIYGEDEEAVWYLTKAMAASSLQNSSSTITPSRRVMWSMLRWQTREWEASSRRRLRRLEENTGTHIRDALRLQAQKSFPHEQQFGGEVWDPLNPHHEISDHLTRIAKKVRKWERPSCNTWQLLSVLVQLAALNHAVCCFSDHIWCFTEEQTTRDNTCVCVSTIQQASGLPVPVSDPGPELCHTSPCTLTATRELTSDDVKGQKLQGRKKKKNHHKILQLAGCRRLPKVWY